MPTEMARMESLLDDCQEAFVMILQGLYAKDYEKVEDIADHMNAKLCSDGFFKL